MKNSYLQTHSGRFDLKGGIKLKPTGGTEEIDF